MFRQDDWTITWQEGLGWLEYKGLAVTTQTHHYIPQQVVGVGEWVDWYKVSVYTQGT